MESLIQKLFIVAVPIVLVVGGLVALFATGALFYVLDNPDDLRKRIEGAFRGTSRPARATGEDHYYQPYWRESARSRQ